MKKAVSLLVALVLALGLTTVAFAAEDDIVSYAENESGIMGINGIAPRLSLGNSGGLYYVDDLELVITTGNNNMDIVAPESRLEPGQEYRFQIKYVQAGTGGQNVSPTLVPLNEQDVAGGKFRLRAVKGSSTISSAKVEKRGSGINAIYTLVINTKENWGTKLSDVEYTLSIINQTNANATAFVDGGFLFQVGWGRFTDNEIDSIGEGDTITIDNDTSVILKKQFETISKNTNYKNIQFEAGDGAWAYLGRVSGMGDTNFYYTHDVVPSIITKFEDQDFHFLTFPAGVSFPTNGEMRIDVSDVSDEFSSMYTYLYRNGKLTPITTTYDSGADELVFRTNYLGSFVITNEQITDLTIIDQGETPAEPAPDAGDNNGGTTTSPNPGTGASRGVELAVVLGLASIAAAGAVSRKRK